VGKGLPFRDAHHAAGAAVAYCIKEKKTLEELTPEEWLSLHPLFGPDIAKAVSISNSINTRKVYGGTAPATVKRRLKAVKKELEKGCC